MNDSNHKIENLVFEGGGVKGAAYAGCIQVLDKKKLLRQVKRVAGTSAGSITATMLACGSGSEGLTQSVMDSNFNQFVYDKGGIIMDIYRLFKKYGIHSGNSFVKILKSYIKKFAGYPELTFAQLEEKRMLEPEKYMQLSVVASNISTHLPVLFNYEQTPNIEIWKAVRASMSIPLVFEPFKISGDYYMDGGLSWIYPIGIYDKKDEKEDLIPNPATLGFYLEPHNLTKDGNDFNPPYTKINSAKTAAEAMYDFLSDNANALHMHPYDKQRSVFIDDLGISATDFNITKTKIKALIESGKKATKKYLENKEVLSREKS